MKKEADKVFTPPAAFQNVNIAGHVIQGRLVTSPNVETGPEETALQFWLNPKITPDFDGGDPQSQIEALEVTTSSLVLEVGDEVQNVFHAIDKGMIYLFAVQGIDNAKLMQAEGEFIFEDVENTALDIGDALQLAGDVYCLRSYMQRGNWDIADAYDMVSAYANIMGFGECELRGNVISLPQLIEQPDEDDNEADSDTPDPDIEIAINDDKTMTLSGQDEDGNLISQDLPFRGDGMLSLFTALWHLGMNRGMNHQEDFPMFTHLYDVMDDRSAKDLINDVVLVKQENPRHAAAIQAFLEMGIPTNRDLH